MTSSWYERLGAQDRSFLVFEGTNTHMHLGGTAIFESAPLLTRAGGIDIDRIRLKSVDADLRGYRLEQDPLDVDAMHWELWPSGPELGYDDLARTLATV